MGSCKNCSYGEYAAAGVATCQSCVAGTYSLTEIGTVAGCKTCPRGSFCVGAVEAKRQAVAQVQSCPLGSYMGTESNGLMQAAECKPCRGGYYCPTPILEKQCPPGTNSPARSSSELQCTCNQGYVCSYTKVINAVVRLKMTLEQFRQEAVQNAFRGAVAVASKADISNVKIMQFGAADTATAGGGRRLLGVSVEKRGVGAEASGGGGEPGIHVFLEVRGGGSDLEGLDGHLMVAGLEPSMDHAWYSPHSVSVREAS